MIGLHPDASGRRLVAQPHGAASPTDSELLKRFAAVRDREALELLVRRHGPMVLGVCRRILGARPDADDAFQATFLVLVRKGATLRRPGLVANWLYGVALRVARKARAVMRRRRDREEPMIDVPAPASLRPQTDLRSLIDKELDRLPEKYRAPIVLCHLEGHTLEEAAQLLGWPKGTVAGRLSRAREQLRGRLANRGLVLSSLGLELGIADQARTVALTDPFIHVAVNGVLNGNVSAAVAALADAAQREMLWRTIAVLLMGLSALLFVALGTAAAVDGIVSNAAGGCHQ